jgi:hypothetical protein
MPREFCIFGTRWRDAIPRSKIRYFCHIDLAGAPQNRAISGRWCSKKHRIRASRAKFQNSIWQPPPSWSQSPVAGHPLLGTTDRDNRWYPVFRHLVVFANPRGILEDAKFRPKTPGCFRPHSRCRQVQLDCRCLGSESSARNQETGMESRAGSLSAQHRPSPIANG